MELGISYPTLHWTYDATFPRIKRQSYDPIKTLAFCLSLSLSLSPSLPIVVFVWSRSHPRGERSGGGARRAWRSMEAKRPDSCEDINDKRNESRR